MTKSILLIFFSTIIGNIFAQNSSSNNIDASIDTNQIIISNIYIKGNKVTKKRIVLRELKFKENDTISKNNLAKLIKRSKENLLNISLFNYVSIKTSFVNKSNINIFINLEERWYLWPYPIFEHADRNLSSFIHNKDWDRINYGLFVLKNNFRGRNEILKIKARYGYKEQYLINYKIPYIDKKGKNGIETNFAYFRQKEIAFNTINNKLQFYQSDNYIREIIDASVSYSYRPRWDNSHLFKLEYKNVSITDTITILNSDYLGDRRDNIFYFNFVYRFTSDKRDSKVYPLKGYVYRISATKFGLFKNPDVNIFYLDAVYSKYCKISNKFYFNSGLKIKKSLKNDNIYFEKQALGYDDFLRAFEYNVIDGNDFFLFRNNFKYELVKPRIKQYEFIPSSKFNKIHYSVYLNLFFDSGYVNDNIYDVSNTMVKEFLYSGGIGIDFVTYYDKIIRFEYSVNKFGNNGFFIHFGAPIFINKKTTNIGRL
ncbi:MAG: hypothetical protein DRJ01_00295 [Bacteroidetes bacterium]|nr:MAG: hypothetical protein DRJ01_00295 [Bacteroidota bacterium]